MYKNRRANRAEKIENFGCLRDSFIYVFCMTSRYHIFSRKLVETPSAKEAEKFVYYNLRA